MRIKEKIDTVDDIKILLVDDDENLLQVCKCTLENKGYITIANNDPKKTIDIIRSENIDILIIDYLMIGITAIQIIEEIRKINYDIYIILMTSHRDLMPADMAMKLDIDSYSEKSHEYLDLLLKVSIAVKSILKYKKYKKDTEGYKFGEKLRYLRQSKYLKQEEIALVLGVGRTTITSYESGINEPSLKHLRKLAEFFNVSIDYLLS